MCDPDEGRTLGTAAASSVDQLPCEDVPKRLRPAFGQLDLCGNLVPPRALDELLLSLRLANQASESKSPEDIRAADELPLFGRSPELATGTTKLEFVDDDGHDDWVEAASAVKEFFVDINKEKNDFDFDAQASRNFKDDGMGIDDNGNSEDKAADEALTRSLLEPAPLRPVTLEETLRIANLENARLQAEVKEHLYGLTILKAQNNELRQEQKDTEERLKQKEDLLQELQGLNREVLEENKNLKAKLAAAGL
jgi:hypothetical protein